MKVYESENAQFLLGLLKILSRISQSTVFRWAWIIYEYVVVERQQANFSSVNLARFLLQMGACFEQLTKTESKLRAIFGRFLSKVKLGKWFHKVCRKLCSIFLLLHAHIYWILTIVLVHNRFSCLNCLLTRVKGWIWCPWSASKCRRDAYIFFLTSRLAYRRNSLFRIKVHTALHGRSEICEPANNLSLKSVRRISRQAFDHLVIIRPCLVIGNEVPYHQYDRRWKFFQTNWFRAVMCFFFFSPIHFALNLAEGKKSRFWIVGRAVGRGNIGGKNWVELAESDWRACMSTVSSDASLIGRRFCAYPTGLESGIRR